MKTPIFNKMILAAMLMLSLGLTACAKKDSGGTKAAGRGGSITTSATCSSGQSSVGSIFKTSAYSYSFDEAVKSFVSATVSGSAFGAINKVDLTLDLKFDTAGALTTSSSGILITITDAYVGTTPTGYDHPIQPYEIQFTQAYSGSLNRSTGAFTVVFQDDLGWIQLSGKISGSTATGEVYFQNYSSVDGHTTNKTYLLGSFTTPACGLLN